MFKDFTVCKLTLSRINSSSWNKIFIPTEPCCAVTQRNC